VSVGTYKETIHDGSVSYPVVRVAPPPGEGKHAKTPAQAVRRHYFNQLRRKARGNSVYGAMVEAMYRLTVKER